MHVLVVGANGLLGSTVVANALDRGWEVDGTFHSTPPDLPVSATRLDLRDTAAVREVVDGAAPDVVVNCAAMTDVDGCESDPDAAEAVNGRGPRVLAAACQERGSAIVHVSTDYVFDGRGDGRYDESAATEPIQVYGRSKLVGETAVRNHHDDPLVVRPSFVYGVHMGRDELVGFPAWVRGRLQEGTTTPLFTDQRITPSRAGSLARTTLDLVTEGATGTYHVASRSCVTPREFGLEICRRMGADESLVEAGSLSDVDRPAERPPKTCLDVSKVESRLDEEQPMLREDLDALGDRFQ